MLKITKILNIIYGLIVVFFLLDSLSSFDIKIQFIKSFIYFGLLFTTPLTLIWNFFFIKKKTRKIIALILPTIALTLILNIGPKKISLLSSAWRTKQFYIKVDI